MPTLLAELSPRIVPVHQFFDAQPLGHATAFVWQRRGASYLITNWHVVTGRNFQTGEHLDTKWLSEPNRLRAVLRYEGQSYDTCPFDISLRGAKNEPLWQVHAEHGFSVDVVAIPLPSPPDHVAYQPINARADDPLGVRVGMDVFVLGYPLALKPPYFPVWKRGSIASEPQLVGLGDRYLLVDTASRPGMSGSPVFRRSWGVHVVESGSELVTAIEDTPMARFIGIYSGRLKPDDELQLGIVWPRQLIDDIIDVPTRDDPATWVWPAPDGTSAG